MKILMFLLRKNLLRLNVNFTLETFDLSIPVKCMRQILLACCAADAKSVEFSIYFMNVFPCILTKYNNQWFKKKFTACYTFVHMHAYTHTIYRRDKAKTLRFIYSFTFHLQYIYTYIEAISFHYIIDNYPRFIERPSGAGEHCWKIIMNTCDIHT